MKYGMSEKIGLIAYGNDDDEVFIGRDLAHTRGYSEEVAREIDGRFPVSSVSAMRMQRASSVRISAFFTAVRPFFSRRKRYIVKSLKHFLQQKRRGCKNKRIKCTKKYIEFCELCAHFLVDTWYYKYRKNPPIHYIVFATPHKKKYLLQKKAA